MDKERKEDIEYKAEQDAGNHDYDPPHSGTFGLRPTVLGGKYSDSEKAERRHYNRVYRDNKSQP